MPQRSIRPEQCLNWDSFSCYPRLCQVDKANQNTYLTQRPVQMLQNVSQFHLTKRRAICGALQQQDECWCSAGILCILFLFSLGCQPTRWYHPYERRVFSQLNLIGNSLTDLGSHYGPSCLSYDLIDSEVHRHPKQWLSYSHRQGFFFFWQCPPWKS